MAGVGGSNLPERTSNHLTALIGSFLYADILKFDKRGILMAEEKSVDTIAMELTERSITRLLSVVRDGETGNMNLVEDQLSDEVYRDLIRQFFERLGLASPEDILKGKESEIHVQHRMVGKAVQISATYSPSTLPHYTLNVKLG